MNHNIYIYILVMAAVTYLIRMLPLALSRKEITSPFIKSFLYYVPYACLAAMTFPAILFATDSVISAAAGFDVTYLIRLKNGYVSCEWNMTHIRFFVKVLNSNMNVSCLCRTYG